MKRTPLARKTPLKRKRAMRRSRPRRIDAMTEDEHAYLAWGHTQQCQGAKYLIGHKCSGPIQMAHLRDHTGMGRKEPPRMTTMLCRELHQDYDQRKGRFAKWDLEAMKMWMRGAIEDSNARFDAERKGTP